MPNTASCSKSPKTHGSIKLVDVSYKRKNSIRHSYSDGVDVLVSHSAPCIGASTVTAWKSLKRTSKEKETIESKYKISRQRTISPCASHMSNKLQHNQSTTAQALLLPASQAYKNTSKWTYNPYSSNRLVHLTQIVHKNYRTDKSFILASHKRTQTIAAAIAWNEICTIPS